MNEDFYLLKVCLYGNVYVLYPYSYITTEARQQGHTEKLLN